MLVTFSVKLISVSSIYTFLIVRYISYLPGYLEYSFKFFYFLNCYLKLKLLLVTFIFLAIYLWHVFCVVPNLFVVQYCYNSHLKHSSSLLYSMDHFYYIFFYYPLCSFSTRWLLSQYILSALLLLLFFVFFFSFFLFLPCFIFYNILKFRFSTTIWSWNTTICFKKTLQWLYIMATIQSYHSVSLLLTTSLLFTISWSSNLSISLGCGIIFTVYADVLMDVGLSLQGT